MNICKICKSSNAKIAIANPKDFEGYAHYERNFSVDRCLDCRSLFISPQPSLSEIKDFYPSNYMAKPPEKGIFSIMKNFWDRHSASNFISEYGKEAFILDYGCGNGEFIDLLKRCGANHVYGFDPMPKENSGLNIYSSVDDLPNIKFDVIRMNDTIEHLSDLDSTMTRIASLLKDGGVIHGSTPNAGHFSSYFFGKYWGLLHFPYHIAIFSPEGMRSMVGRLKFDKLLISKSAVPSCWAFLLEHFFKEVLGGRRQGHLAAYPIFLVLAIPIVLLDLLLPGCTSQMTFRVKK